MQFAKVGSINQTSFTSAHYIKLFFKKILTVQTQHLVNGTKTDTIPGATLENDLKSLDIKPKTVQLQT